MELHRMDVPAYIRAGHSVCIRSIEPTLPEASRLVARIRQLLGWRGIVDLRVYASDAGAGFDLHSDQRSSFVLQLFGTKRWKVTDKSLENGELFVSQGDVFFIPAGTFHETRSESMSVALNISFAAFE